MAQLQYICCKMDVGHAAGGLQLDPNALAAQKAELSMLSSAFGEVGAEHWQSVKSASSGRLAGQRAQWVGPHLRCQGPPCQSTFALSGTAFMKVVSEWQPVNTNPSDCSNNDVHMSCCSGRSLLQRLLQ